MRIIIIGAGLAGQLVLRELREKGVDCKVQLFSEHHAHFYLKPSLSNVVTQNKTPDDLVMMSQEDVAEAFNCEVFPYTQVLGIDQDKQLVKTDKGEYPYDRLVLALGALPIEPPWLKVSDNIFRVNHLEEYKAFYERIGEQSTVAIIGGGLIGVEFSHDLSARCKKVTLIEKMPYLMQAMLPTEIGVELDKALTQRGVEVLCEKTVQSCEDKGDRVEITLDDKTVVSDVAIGAIGIRPNISLAQAAGLETNMGICTNEYGQTSDKHIFALGDCAEVMGIVKCYVAPLKICAKTVAQNLIKVESPIAYPPMPVMLKTPSYPVCFCYKVMPMDWEITVSEEGVEAVAYEGEQVIGFALTGKALPKRLEYQKTMQNWL